MWFGAPRRPPAERTFTGQIPDASDLLYDNARDYDLSLGMFLPPDSMCLSGLRKCNGRGNSRLFADVGMAQSRGNRRCRVTKRLTQ